MTNLLNIHKKAEVPLMSFNNIEVPIKYSDFEKEYHALRKNILMSDISHYTKIQLEGDEAYDLLENVFTGYLSEVRDEQVLYCFLLDDQGEILSDVYIMNNDETYIVLSERIEDQELMEILEENKQDLEVEITSLTKDKSIVCFDGPYSWELTKAHFGMDVIGIPFMGFLIDEEDEETIILRAGKSGEFCYKVIADHDKAEEVWQKSLELGERFDLCLGGAEIQNVSRIENPYWLPQKFSNTTKLLTELQMQWMVRYDKDEYIGKEALESKRQGGIKNRVVGIQVTNKENRLADGASVHYKAEEIGKVMASVFSPTMDRYIGLAYLKSNYAYSGIQDYTIESDDGATIPIFTCGTPFFTNFSFMINPNEHSYVDPNKHKNLLEQIEAGLKAQELEGETQGAEAENQED